MRCAYHGSVRVAQPQCHGRGHRGTGRLRGRQVNGRKPAERPFDVAQLTGLTLLVGHLDGPRRHYRRGDCAMAKVVRRL